MLRRRAALSGALAVASVPVRPATEAGAFETLADWTFGTGRPGATMRTRAQLDAAFRYRYFYDQGRLDRLPTYWSVHRDYPEADPRNLHRLGPDRLTLAARIPAGGGLFPGGIESAMLRALLPVTEGMWVEMRARLPRGLGVWPAFWLNPGVEAPPGHFSAAPWPPEIDIFEFFVWQGRTTPRLLQTNVQTAGRPATFGTPTDLFNRAGPHGYDTGTDYAADFHVFALDWQPGRPRWLVDGVPIRQTTYAWPAPPAHILVTNQIGMSLAGVDLRGMPATPQDWTYDIDYLRVFRRR